MRQNSPTMNRVGGVFLKFLVSWAVFLVAATCAFHEYILQRNIGMGRLVNVLPDRSSPPLLHTAAMKALSMLEKEKSIVLKTRYSSRLRQVREMCTKSGLGGNLNNLTDINSPRFIQTRTKASWSESIIYSQEFNLTYCWIHKAASTSWNEIFYRLAGYKIDGQRVTVKGGKKQGFYSAANYLQPKSARAFFGAMKPSTLKFIVVRHPFHRLVSAWVDKFKLGPKSNYMFKTYVPKIKDAKVGLTNPKERPTFPQFIDYLLVTDISEYNDHWIPYWLHCKICWIEYDIIAKFETLSEDSSFILKAANVTTLGMPWENSLEKVAVGAQTPKVSRDSMTKYTAAHFAELSKSQINGLIQIYRMDFEMFGYSLEDYSNKTLLS